MNRELVDHDRLEEIVQQVNDEYALMTGDMTRAVQRAIRIGEMLTEAKGEVAHGEWIPWIERNLVFGRSEASRYMKVYRNGARVQHLDSLREAVALLAEPRDEPTTEPAPADVQTAPAASPSHPDISPVLDDEPEPAREPEYRNDPALERKLREMKDMEGVYQAKIEGAQDAIDAKERELAKLRKLEADKERVETALRDLQRLEERKTELFKDAESTKLVHEVLLRSREFFTRECMQIAALQIRPEAVKAMQQDFAGLIELVENWLEAMKGRFL